MSEEPPSASWDHTGELPVKGSRIDIASIRREQIVRAALDIIGTQGIDRLSLSEIEKRTGMKRGQLTYYFKFKEDILLAAFDHLVTTMMRRVEEMRGDPSHPCQAQSGLRMAREIIAHVLTHAPLAPEFSYLQYAFLSQVAHRDDFRQRLASLYEFWRSDMAERLGQDLSAKVPSSRAVATLVQAIIHGLVMQLTADPSAFDRAEVLDLCQRVLNCLETSRPIDSGESS